MNYSSPSKEGFLLGHLMARMEIIHNHLIHAENDNALSVMNELMRFIKSETQKLYNGEVHVNDPV